LTGVGLETGGERAQGAVPDQALARALADSGFAYVAAPRLAASLARELAAPGRIVLDLRGARGGDAAPDSLAAIICDRERIVVLIDERTYGDPEILAERLRAQGCAHLAGRPTAGAGVATRSHRLATGGTLFEPLAVVGRSGSSGGIGEGVIAELYVSPREGPAVEPWLAAALRAARGRGR
jgi:hypothetical protein